MPNRKLTKEENQPSIKTLLLNRTESVECINVDQEGANSEIDVNNISNSNTVRSCTDTDYATPAPTSSGSPQNQPSNKVNITEVINMDGQGLPPNQPTPQLPWK